VRSKPIKKRGGKVNREPGKNSIRPERGTGGAPKRKRDFVNAVAGFEKKEIRE